MASFFTFSADLLGVRSFPAGCSKPPPPLHISLLFFSYGIVGNKRIPKKLLTKGKFCGIFHSVVLALYSAGRIDGKSC